MRPLRPNIRATARHAAPLTLTGALAAERRARDLAERVEQQDAVAELSHTKAEQHAAARNAQAARRELVRHLLGGLEGDRAARERLADWVDAEPLSPDALDRLAAVLRG